ncbi:MULTISPECIES: hypothetical protein [unclassified Streptomyces]
MAAPSRSGPGDTLQKVADQAGVSPQEAADQIARTLRRPSTS